MTLKSSFFYAIRVLLPLQNNSSESVRNTDDAKTMANGKKRQSARQSLLGAMLCIGLSLIPLVAVLVISDGMIEGMTARIIGLSSSHLKVVYDDSADEVSSAENLLSETKRLENTDGVKLAYPELQGIALAAGKSGRTGATIRAVLPDIFERNESFNKLFKVEEGETDLFEEKSAVIGSKMSELLGIHTGDSIRLITTRNLPNGKVVPKIKSFKVKAVVSSGYQELDALWVFISLEDGYSLLDLSLADVYIGIETSDAFSSELLRVQHNLEKTIPFNDASIYRWNELNAAEYENFSSTKLLLMFIMLLIVFVASVNVSSALVMLVMERRKEIAILKSIGGNSSGIVAAFLFMGVICGLGGVVLGIPLGLLCAVNCNEIINFSEKILNIIIKFVYLLKGQTLYADIHLLDPAYYLQDIPISVPLKELLYIGCGTLILSLLVSALPAMKAGKEKPLDTLRKI